VILLALGFVGGIALTAAAVLIPGRFLSVPEPDPADTADASTPTDEPGESHA
jgi:hypothetical protein